MSTTAIRSSVSSLDDALYFNNWELVVSLLKTNKSFTVDETATTVHTESCYVASSCTEEVYNSDYDVITFKEFLDSVNPKFSIMVSNQCRAAEAKKSAKAQAAIAEASNGVVINSAAIQVAQSVAPMETAKSATVVKFPGSNIDIDEEFEAAEKAITATPEDVCAGAFPAKLTALNKAIDKPTWPGGSKATVSKATGELLLTPTPNFENFVYMLTQYGIRIRFNVLRLSIDCELAPHARLSASDKRTFEFGQAAGIQAIVSDLCIINNMKCTPALLNTHLYRNGSSNSFNPIEDYLRKLPKWDGVDYVTMCANCLPAPKDFDREWGTELFKRHLVSWVAMSMEPGRARASSVFILTGGQGKGKSTFLSKLMPNLPHIFKDGVSLDINNKDSRLQVLSHGAVELAEIAHTLSKTNVEGFKQITSSLTREERPPYASSSIEVPRFTLFFGTSNDKDFLVDYSGSRRFWVWDVGSVGETGTIARMPANFNVDQLWAQVLELYNNGCPYWLDEAEQIRNEGANVSFSGFNVVRDAILRTFEDALDSNLKPLTSLSMVWLSASELANMCGVDLTRNSKEFSRQLRVIFGEPRKQSTMKYHVPDIKNPASSQKMF